MREDLYPNHFYLTIYFWDKHYTMYFYKNEDPITSKHSISNNSSF